MATLTTEQIEQKNLNLSLDVSLGLNQIANRFAAAYTNPMMQNMALVSLSVPIVDWGKRRHTSSAALPSTTTCAANLSATSSSKASFLPGHSVNMTFVLVGGEDVEVDVKGFVALQSFKFYREAAGLAADFTFQNKGCPGGAYAGLRGVVGKAEQLSHRVLGKYANIVREGSRI